MQKNRPISFVDNSVIRPKFKMVGYARNEEIKKKDTIMRRWSIPWAFLVVIICVLLIVVENVLGDWVEFGGVVAGTGLPGRQFGPVKPRLHLLHNLPVHCAPSQAHLPAKCQSGLTNIETINHRQINSELKIYSRGYHWKKNHCLWCTKLLPLSLSLPEQEIGGNPLRSRREK